MSARMLAILLALAPLPAVAQTAVVAPPVPDPVHPWVAACKNWDEWDKSGPPFKVFGNTYYVGTCGITAMLITSRTGHVLIDSGTEQGADVVLANIRKLGFDPGDVKILLSSHEHYDHIGGMAKLQAATGAKVFASASAAQVLRSGKADRDDPQSGMHEPMRPVEAVGIIRAGQKVRYDFDKLVLTPIFTPEHTPGATSWSWQSCEGKDCRTLVYADSLSPVSRDDYRFSDHPAYLAAFRGSLERLAGLKCDLLLTPHPSASAMREVLQREGDLAHQSGNPCDHHARSAGASLRVRLLKEAGQP